MPPWWLAELENFNTCLFTVPVSSDTSQLVTWSSFHERKLYARNTKLICIGGPNQGWTWIPRKSSHISLIFQRGVISLPGKKGFKWYSGTCCPSLAGTHTQKHQSIAAILCESSAIHPEDHKFYLEKCTFKSNCSLFRQSEMATVNS